MSVLLIILNHTTDINTQTIDFKYDNEPFALCLDLAGRFIVSNSSMAVFVPGTRVQ